MCSHHKGSLSLLPLFERRVLALEKLSVAARSLVCSNFSIDAWKLFFCYLNLNFVSSVIFRYCGLLAALYHVCVFIHTYVLVKPWPFVVSDIYHTSEASVINVMTPQRAMV